MKTPIPFSLVFCTFLFITSAFSQGRWEARTSFPPGPRERAFHFTIGDKLYVGAGRGIRGGGFNASINETDFWSYDFATDTWEELRSFPGQAFRNGASFVIDGIAYVVTGHNGSAYIDPFWKYDPATDTWEELPAFPGGPRSFPATFAIDGKGYVALGGIQQNVSGAFFGQDLWEYDPATGTWTEKTSFPGPGRWRPFAFVIDGQAYVSGGDREGLAGLQDCYRYDPATDSWTRVADFPSTYGVGGYAFTLDGKGYVGEGAQDEFLDYRTKVWEYNPNSDTWTHVSNTPGAQVGRTYAFTATHEGKAYVGGGRNVGNPTLAPMFGDFYEWDKNAAPEVPDYANWSGIGRSTVDSSLVGIHSLRAIDEDTIWALPTATHTPSGGPLEIMRTEDGGSSWQTTVIDTTRRFAFGNLFAFDGQRVWVLGSLTDGATTLYHSSDGGQTWTKKLDAEDNNMAEAVGIHFFDDDNGLCWGNDAGLFNGGSLTLYRTSDGGETWQLAEDASLPAPQNGQYSFTASGNNNYEAIGDTIWLPVGSAFGSENTVFRSTDRGVTWTSSENLPAFIWSLAFENAQRGILTTDNMGAPLHSRAFTTEDGGETWTEVAMPETPLATAIEYIPGADGAYLAHSPRFPDQKMSYTPNFGQDWYVFEAPPTLHSIQFLSEDTGFGGGPLLRDIPAGIYRWQGDFGAIVRSGRLYVKADATGANTGASWTDAFTNLQDALASAETGNSIWIAGGTYITDPAQADTSQAFVIDKNLEIYGGFAGTENHLSERDTANNTTILSGDLGEDDIPGDWKTNRSDNALHVMIIDSTVNDNTIIDGLTIQGGHADGPSEVSGGGMYIKGSPVIRHCVYKNNYAVDDGGGAFVRGADADGISFDNCRFEQNGTGDKGGGIAVWELTTEGIAFDHCVFSQNSGEYGGGMYILNSNIDLSHTDIRSNRVAVNGGGIRILYIDGIEGLSGGAGLNAEIDNCSIAENTATLGAGLYFNSNGPENNFSLTNTAVQNNRAEEAFEDVFQLGGGLYLISSDAGTDSRILVDNCTLTGNRSDIGSGGVELLLRGQSSQVEFNRTTFLENQADNFGGGVRMALGEPASGSRVAFNDCTFNGNSVRLGGGGVHCYSEADNTLLSWSDCLFESNQSMEEDGEAGNGGGINILIRGGENQSITIERSRFSENLAKVLGGGIEIDTRPDPGSLNVSIDSCSFTGNKGSTGGGLCTDIESTGIHFSVTRSTFTANEAVMLQANNSPAISGGACLASFGSGGATFVVDSCTFSENTSQFKGAGLVFFTSGSTGQQIQVRHSSFTNNRAGTLGGGLTINSDGEASYDIDHCRFSGNSAVRRGGGLWIAPNSSDFHASIRNSIWNDNSSERGAALSAYFEGILPNVQIIFPEGAEISIDNSLFYGNTGENSTIDGNGIPGLILTNCTLADNEADGIHLTDESTVALQNTILFNPGFTEYQALSGDVTATSLGGNLLGDQSMAGIVTGLDLQDTDPLFEGAGSYQLTEGSPAIDAGVTPDEVPEFDLAGNPRVIGAGIDIGAFESQLATSLKATLAENSSLSLAPNPVSADLNIALENDWRGPFRLLIYDVLGRLLIEQPVSKTATGWKQQISVGHLPPGNYYLVLSNGKYFTNKAFVVE